MNKPELLLEGDAFLREDSDGITRLYETFASYTAKMNSLAFDIAQASMKGTILRPTKVLTIPRGGLSPTEFVSRTLGLTAEHVVSFGCRTYAGEAKKGELVVGQLPSRELIEGEVVVVPEDVADTGETLEIVKEKLWSLNPEAVITAAVYWKKQSEAPDFYVEATDRPDRWIVFPTNPNDEYAEFYKAQMALPADERTVNQAVLLG